MIDGKITIGGVEHPYRRSLAAWNNFDLKFKHEGVSVLRLGEVQLSVEHIASLLYFVIEAGYKAEKREFNMTFDEFLDAASDKDLQAFNVSVMGVGGGDSSSTAGEKKT